MILDRTLTASVYIVYKDKVLLHMHKKYKTLFPLGGHMKSYELPDEAAIREVKEEAGLDIELIKNNNELSLSRVKEINTPMHILLENIGKEVENIDFIYYAKTNTYEVNPLSGESKELIWFSENEIIENDNIKPHIKKLALDALDKVSSLECE